MPKAYWIGRVEVHDEEGYKPYAAANPAIFRKYGGRFLVRAGKYQCTEGESRSRNVVIEFPDYASARATTVRSLSFSLRGRGGRGKVAAPGRPRDPGRERRQARWRQIPICGW